MKQELRRIGVISIMKISAAIGLVCGILYALIMVPFFLIGTMASGEGNSGIVILLIVIVCVVIAFPVMMAVSYGIMAALYNLFAKFIGGVEFEIEENK